MNKKVLVSLFFSAIIVVVALYFIMDLYLYIYDPTWRGIIFQKYVSNKPYIFIVGSSYVYSINSTYISDYLGKNNQEYDVYNLADMGDTPSHRIKYLDHLISLKPKLIIYGVGITDFENPYYKKDASEIFSINNLPSEILQPKKFFSDILLYLTNNGFDTKFATSPKEKTILTLKYIIRGPEYAHHPFINFQTVPITNKKDLESSGSQITFVGVDISENNKEKNALKKVLTNLKENNIKVVIFSTPYHKVFLNKVTNNDETVFVSTLENIAKQYDIDVYFLHKKYESLDIWRDPVHVAVNKNASIYSDGIAKIILDELEN